jgi:hypothetical protein
VSQREGRRGGRLRFGRGRRARRPVAEGGRVAAVAVGAGARSLLLGLDHLGQAELDELTHGGEGVGSWRGPALHMAPGMPRR